MGEEREGYKVLVGKPEGKMVTRKTEASMGGWDLMDPEAGVEWIQLAQDRDR
jgi:hypothetical protein